nr:hypothetical protein [Mycoplasmopsis bovis]
MKLLLLTALKCKNEILLENTKNDIIADLSKNSIVNELMHIANDYTRANAQKVNKMDKAKVIILYIFTYRIKQSQRKIPNKVIG